MFTSQSWTRWVADKSIVAAVVVVVIGQVEVGSSQVNFGANSKFTCNEPGINATSSLRVVTPSLGLVRAPLLGDDASSSTTAARSPRSKTRVTGMEVRERAK
jgi:hypothetical protein